MVKLFRWKNNEREEDMDIRLCDDGNLDEALKILKDEKVGVEVQAFHDPRMKNIKKEIKRYQDAYADIKPRSLHAPFWDLNLGSGMPDIRKTTMKWFNYAYKIAKELGCDSIVVHDGYVPYTSHMPNWIKRSTTFWQEFFADKDDSVTMMIENMLELDSSVMVQAIDALNDKRLKACLDIGHAHCNSNMPVDEWIKTLGERIGYLHLHNNHGQQNNIHNDEHNGYDNGTIDFKNVIKLVKKHCPNAILAVESHLSEAQKTIAFLKQYTR